MIFVLEVFKGGFPWQAAMAHWKAVKTNPRVAKSIQGWQNQSIGDKINQQPISPIAIALRPKCNPQGSPAAKMQSTGEPCG